MHTIRVATHCTEADVSEQHIGMARKLGMDTVGFLMMAHMAPVQMLVQQALLMESYGANCLYITDSAGHMLPHDVTEKLSAVRQRLRPETELGFHSHHNLAMGAWPTRWPPLPAAPRARSAAAAGWSAGAGNTPMEVLVAVCERMGIETGVDVFGIADVAEDLVVPIMDHPIRLDRDALTLGYAGVCSSFLLFAKRAEAKYRIPAREILVELGRQRLVGGQEDMIEDTAITLAREPRGCWRTDQLTELTEHLRVKLADPVDKNPHARRKLPVIRVEHRHRQVRARPVGQHLHQPA
ncbi:4-hydroxy-2-oxovalerate aldolase [Cupriavidus basilensis]